MTEFTELAKLDATEYDLPGRVIGAAMQVHRTLGAGFLESVYERALAHELSKQKLGFVLEQPLSVHYDGVSVGSYFADIVVENCLIVEIKAIQALTKAHEAQLVNYLTATRIDVGLLLNFGGQSLEFKRKQRTYRLSNP